MGHDGVGSVRLLVEVSRGMVGGLGVEFLWLALLSHCGLLRRTWSVGLP